MHKQCCSFVPFFNGSWVLNTCVDFAAAGHPAVRPFRGGLLCKLSQFQGKHTDKMLWGTYRPGLYLGAAPYKVHVQWQECNPFGLPWT